MNKNKLELTEDQLEELYQETNMTPTSALLRHEIKPVLADSEQVILEMLNCAYRIGLRDTLNNER